MKRLLPFLKDKFYITGIIFVIWMLFLDRNDMFTQIQYVLKLNRIKTDQQYFQKEIELVKKELEELSTNQNKLEKFAREKYLMKRENEVVFVIVKE